MLSGLTPMMWLNRMNYRSCERGDARATRTTPMTRIVQEPSRKSLLRFTISSSGKLCRFCSAQP